MARGAAGGGEGEVAGLPPAGPSPLLDGLRRLVARHSAGELSSEEFLRNLSGVRKAVGECSEPEQRAAPALHRGHIRANGPPGSFTSRSSASAEERLERLQLEDVDAPLEQREDRRRESCCSSSAVLTTMLVSPWPVLSAAEDSVASPGRSSGGQSSHRDRGSRVSRHSGASYMGALGEQPNATPLIESGRKGLGVLADLPQLLSASEAAALLRRSRAASDRRERGQDGFLASGVNTCQSSRSSSSSCSSRAIGSRAAQLLREEDSLAFFDLSASRGHGGFRFPLETSSAGDTGRAATHRSGLGDDVEDSPPPHLGSEPVVVRSSTPQVYQHRYSMTSLPGQLCRDGREDTTSPSPLPLRQSGSGSFCGSSSSMSGFHERSEHWQQRCAQKREALQRQCVERASKECLFQPKLVARDPDGEHHRRRPLGQLAQSTFPTRQAWQTAWLERREEEMMKECTFAPDVSKSASSLRLSLPQHGDIESISSEGSGRVGEGGAKVPARASGFVEPSFTFQPQTNPIAPHMTIAQALTRRNVFDRLNDSRSRHSSAPPAVATLERSASRRRLERGSSGDGKGSKDSRLSTTTPFPSSLEGLTRVFSDAGADTEPHSTDSNESLLQFLRRQNECEEVRLERLRRLTLENTPEWRPALCLTSRRLAERGRSARSPITAPNLPSSMTLATTAEAAAKEAEDSTFRPVINVASARRPQRGCAELSQGDAQRRAASADALRAKLEAQLLVEAPFVPSLTTSRSSASIELTTRTSLLDPDEYLRNIADRRSVLRAKGQEEQRLRDEARLIECTFRPKVNAGAPEYVRQMAQTHRAAKLLREKETRAPQVQIRPDWR